MDRTSNALRSCAAVPENIKNSKRDIRCFLLLLPLDPREKFPRHWVAENNKIPAWISNGGGGFFAAAHLKLCETSQGSHKEDRHSSLFILILMADS